MFLLSDQMMKRIKADIGELRDPVNILFFKPENFAYEGELNLFAARIKELSPKLNVDVLAFEQNRKKALEYGVDKAPAIILEGQNKRKVRFFGLPIGGEFSTMLLDIKDLSLGGPELSSDIARRVMEIDFPVHMQVFVTSNCSFCPQVGKLAHDFA